MYKKKQCYLGVCPVTGCTISLGGLVAASAEIKLDMDESDIDFLKFKISFAINLQFKSLLKASSIISLK